MVRFTSRKEKEGNFMKQVKRGIATVGGVIILTIGWFNFTETIPQGHEGVVFSRSTGVEEKTLSQGLHFVNPMKKITAYPVSTETVDNKLSLATVDGKPLSVTITYDYFNNSEKLPYIYNKFKGQKPETIEESWLKSRIKDSALAVTSKYTILQVFQERDVIKTEIQNHFQKDVKEHGFIIENVVFGTPKPDKDTTKAIQQVVNQQQELEALKVKKQKAQVEAEKKLIEAKGKADAHLVTAKANAEANKILDASLTDKVLERQKLEKWNGTLPQVTGGAGTLVNIK